MTITAESWGTVAEAAAAWKVEHKTVRRWITQQRCEAVRVGPRMIRVRLDSLQTSPLGGGVSE